MRQLVAFTADVSEQLNELGCDLECQRAGMTHYFSWQMKQSPAYCCHPVMLPIATQGRMLEQDKQVMSDYADAKKGGICFELSAGHAFHAKADFQFFDTIFRDFATLAIPD